MAYIGLSIVYDFALDDEGKKGFEDISAYCSKYTSSLPIILLLGFFTSTSMQRWFSLVHSMPGTTRVIASFVMSIKEGHTEGYQIVEQYSRWIVLGWALTFRLICKPLKRVFPTLVSLENAGLLLPHERLQLENELASNHPIVVVQWNLALLKRCNRQGMFMDFSDYQRNQDNLMTFKKSCGDTIKFAAKNIPFALIQAVTITVYSYGLASLMARQLTDEHTPTSFTIRYFPVLNAFQYFLYYLWLQFGRLAAYPFSDDENDIDIKRLLQAHVDDAVRWQSLYSSPGLTEQIVSHSLHNSSHEWMNLACPKAQKGLISEPLANGNNQESALIAKNAIETKTKSIFELDSDEEIHNNEGDSGLAASLETSPIQNDKEVNHEVASDNLDSREHITSSSEELEISKLNEDTRDNVPCLSAFQKARIERNRQKALLLRQARLQAHPYKNGNTEEHSVIRIKNSRLIDSGGGFLINEKELEEEQQREIVITEDPAPIILPDRPHCDECEQPLHDSLLYRSFSYPVEKRALELWETLEKIEEEKELRETKREKSKIKKFNQQVKSLRMAVRSSVYKKLTAGHQHVFGEEKFDAERDLYYRKCSTCSFQQEYEKM
uniref:Bestrophin homolog n=1 Tax=Daphnia similis TaxID=35528 RepID=A0A4Y7LR60_9CRUS|nr:EOG090X0KP6 [Daphnia similis]SVE72088.1 EOG090X0KP6 [Daphnia similis]